MSTPRSTTEQLAADENLEMAAYSNFILRGLDEQSAREAASLMTSFVWLVSMLAERAPSGEVRNV